MKRLLPSGQGVDRGRQERDENRPAIIPAFPKRIVGILRPALTRRSGILVLFLLSTPNAMPQTEASSSLRDLVAAGAEPRLLADGFKFTEGPAADAKGNVFFTDIGSNRIHYWDTATETLSTIREDSGGADGLFVDREGALWICELRDKRLAKIDANGAYRIIVDSFQGQPLTGANDLWIDQYGGVYFSDSYGGSQTRTQDHRVFYLSPEGKLSLVAGDFFKSNGLQGTANGKWLYISDYIANQVYRYELISPGVVGERTVFAEYRCDGMTLDEQGNLYLCTGNAGHGIVVFNAAGEELGKIELPENPANVCFGGPNSDTLFISATHGFYSLEMSVRGNDYNSPQKPILTDERGLSALIKPDALPERLATDFRIAQGPAPDAQGDVYFSDIYRHKIMKWRFGDGSLQTIHEQPGGPDGLFVEADGSLLVCELTGLRFARLYPNGEYSIIAEAFEGQPLTGPNDVYVDEAGGIYFSDSYPGSNIREPVHCVYYIAPGSSELKRIVDDHYKTKGIHASADGKWLYIADYGGRKVYRYELLAPGVLGGKELFIDTRCGGLAVDELGNVYISTVGDHLGVLVYDPEGQRIGRIMYPENTTNAAFGGPNRDKLMVTTFKSLYSLDMNVRGMR